MEPKAAVIKLMVTMVKTTRENMARVMPVRKRLCIG
jgi:hypothetical protein